MKKLLSILFTIIAIQMSLSSQVDEKALFQKKIKTYTRMKNTGIMLTVGGGIIGAIGFGVASSAPDGVYAPSDEAIAGGIITISGIIMVGCGVTFWTIGGVNKAKYTKKLNALTLNLNPGKHQTISLVYRF